MTTSDPASPGSNPNYVKDFSIKIDNEESNGDWVQHLGSYAPCKSEKNYFFDSVIFRPWIIRPVCSTLFSLQSPGYWRRLLFQRSWVRIPAPYTGWTFFNLYFFVKIVMFVWKDENKRKRGRALPLFKKCLGSSANMARWTYFGRLVRSG